MLAEKYNPKDFEEKIYKNWEESGYFGAEPDNSKIPYTIVIPPPNITGKLHMGHALDNTIQDILIRYKRMAGFNALWVPGTDHAAIATELKVVEKLKAEGTSKDEIGREKFLEKTWEWKREYGGTIVNQLKKLGCSCDWSRERFTMDPGLSSAVEKVFINLYNKGLIYKGKRMTNWCGSCHTTISDAEVEFEEEATNLWHIKYERTDGKGYIVVATTRPETMLGDTGIAVNPKDTRYKDLIGKTVILPIVNKEIPVIADPFVEMEFGTGAVKLTPAHDANDYEAGKKNNLEIVEVFDESGIMLDIVKKYEGMDLKTARKEVVKDLEAMGVLLKTEDYTHNVGKCHRCHQTIEPRPSLQWFVKMESLAKPAIEAVKSGEIKFVPDKYEKTYFNWMENIQDWCISRQLWWGHRIPAYYCQDCGEIIVSDTAPEKCSKCGSNKLEQDPDTLDTWFSSALWPFSILGWPEETEDLKYFYPTSTLVTGYDIITFWVSRMIFSGLEHMGQIPFDTVLIHGLVRDGQGRKMSKSLGNGVDPLEIIEQYGADALRFSLLLGTTPGNDLRYLPEKLESASNFGNKIFNAAKFIMMNNVGAYDSIRPGVDNTPLQIEDKWIINKYNKLVVEVTNNLDKYDLGIALQKIYEFIWNEFCDWYVEMVKPRLYDKENPTRNAALYTLTSVFSGALQLLHPFMPYTTDEIYSNLADDENIMISKWPELKEKLDFEKEEIQIETIKNMITEIRNVRANMNIHPSKKSKIIFVTKEGKDTIENGKLFIQRLGFAEEVVIQEDKTGIPDNAIAIAVPGIELFIPFTDLVDIKEEIGRLEEKKAKLKIELDKSNGLLSNAGFVAKAPEAKIKEEKDKVDNLNELIANIDEQIKKLNNI